MSDKEGKKTIPLHEGLFSWPSEDPRLIGSKCSACGEVMFPKKSYCKNPECSKGNIEDVLLSKRGKLYSFTIIHSVPPPPFDKVHNVAPYGLALVELPEKLIVLGLLTTCDTQQLVTGRNMEMVVERMCTDDAGNDVVTYKFKPV
jgi:uncharacterized OB-fold protein